MRLQMIGEKVLSTWNVSFIGKRSVGRWTNKKPGASHCQLNPMIVFKTPKFRRTVQKNRKFAS